MFNRDGLNVAVVENGVAHIRHVPGREFPGRVTRIANALQPGSRTLLTEIDLPNPDYVLSRNIDVGSLVQADATSGRFLFTLMHVSFSSASRRIPPVDFLLNT